MKIPKFSQEVSLSLTKVFTGNPYSESIPEELFWKSHYYECTEEYVKKTIYKNAELVLSSRKILKNIKEVQTINKMDNSHKMDDSISPFVLNIGNTADDAYSDIFWSIMRLNKFYGWSKYIIIVPDVHSITSAYRVMRETGIDEKLPRHHSTCSNAITCYYKTEQGYTNLLPTVENLMNIENINYGDNDDAKLFRRKIQDFVFINGLKVLLLNPERLCYKEDGSHLRLHQPFCSTNESRLTAVDLIGKCRPIVIYNNLELDDKYELFNPLFNIRITTNNQYYYLCKNDNLLKYFSK
jgi:restriction endonuclease